MGQGYGVSRYGYGEGSSFRGGGSYGDIQSAGSAPIRPFHRYGSSGGMQVCPVLVAVTLCPLLCWRLQHSLHVCTLGGQTCSQRAERAVLSSRPGHRLAW